MEKEEFGNFSSFGFYFGDWIVTATRDRFRINNKGIKMLVTKEEDLKKVIFDTKTKTISMVVENPTLQAQSRTLVLENDIELFEEIRKDIEHLLTKMHMVESVTPNEDRTVFEINNKNEQ